MYYCTYKYDHGSYIVFITEFFCARHLKLGGSVRNHVENSDNINFCNSALQLQQLIIYVVDNDALISSDVATMVPVYV